MRYFLSCARGLEPLAEQELQQFGLESVKPTSAGVWFEADIEAVLRVCLWTRVGSRVLLPLFDCEATGDALHGAALDFDWATHLQPKLPLAIDFSGTNDDIRHTRFGALRLKDGIADAYRTAGLATPEIEDGPSVQRLSARIERRRISVALDLCGEGLHRRGYRERQGIAPLRETLAAALLMRAGWLQMVAQDAQAALYDPMCGSGTLLIEGAMMALDRAPALGREDWAMQHWPLFDRSIWANLVAETDQRFDAGRARWNGRIVGGDIDSRIIHAARDNASRAGVHGQIEFTATAFGALPPSLAATVQNGLLITNPPYGERMGERDQSLQTYRELGEQLAQNFQGWRAAVLAPDEAHGRATGLHSYRHTQVQNGNLDCRFYLFNIDPKVRIAVRADGPKPSAGAEMVAARIRKNRARLKSWLQREQIDCWRVYDADIPEYSAAIDLYRDSEDSLWLVVQEYAAPAEIDEKVARHRLNELCTGAGLAFDLPPDRVLRKVRKRQKGSEQYRPADNPSGREIEVCEGPVRIGVNLTDYLDTGLFLDHRPVRRWIREHAKGRRFLNLFCYTAVATLHAAVGGARDSLSLDMSNTYLGWAQRNFERNRLSPWHRLQRVDCLAWLRDPPLDAGPFDLILLDPPTFSNSARMEDSLDVQRDHLIMIEGAMRLLAADGTLVFSNNYRRFKLDPSIAERFAVTDFHQESLDPDFQRNPRIHTCFLIRHATA